MDVFDEEILSFWRSLQDNSVKYILVGDYAGNLHGYHRFTGSLAIWIEDTLENRYALRMAFNSRGMDKNMEFVPGWSEFHLNNNIRLDIIFEMKGLESYTFDECLQMASIANIENVTVPFLHINQLIANKKEVNRPKDQIDVLALEEIRRLRGNTNRSDE